MDLGQWNTYKTKWNHNADTKMYSNKDLFASLNKNTKPHKPCKYAVRGAFFVLAGFILGTNFYSDEF